MKFDSPLLIQPHLCVFVCRDDDSDDEIDDQDIHKIMIVTQTPPPIKKHDRTGSYVTRVKMTQELSKAINDGLYYYEQVWQWFLSSWSSYYYILACAVHCLRLACETFDWKAGDLNAVLYHCVVSLDKKLCSTLFPSTQVYKSVPLNP